MSKKCVIFALCVIQILLFCQTAFALNENQTNLIRQIEFKLNLTNNSLVNLIESLDVNITVNQTLNVTQQVNWTEMQFMFYTRNETEKQFEQLDSEISDRFSGVREYYLQKEDFNSTFDAMVRNVTSAIDNTTNLLWNNQYELDKTTADRFAMTWFLLAVALGGLAYTGYNMRKNVINVNKDVKGALPDVAFEEHPIDELDSSKSFLNRLKGITALKTRVKTMKMPEDEQNRIMDKIDSGLVSDAEDIKRESEALKYGIGANRYKIQSRAAKKDRPGKRK